MERSEIAILIPALNESKTIFSVVHKIKNFVYLLLLMMVQQIKLILYAKKAGANLIKHKKNLGYDQSLNSGFKALI